MLQLIHNENVKIYRRLRTWIFGALLLLAVIAMAALTDKASHSQATHTSWRQELKQENQQLQQTLDRSGDKLPASTRTQLQTQINENQYRLDHDIPPAKNSAWDFTNSAASLMVLVTLFAAVVAADIIASEFSSGAIKLLLIRPVRRSKILMAKYAASLLFALALIVELAVAAWLVGGIVFGFDGFATPYLYADTSGHIHQMPMFAHVLSTYGLKCVNLLMIVTISFMISVLLRSSSLAIAISLLLLFVGSTLVEVLSNHTWVKFILFANTDLTQYMEGTPVVKGMTLTFSIIVLAVYFVIFHVVSWLTFTRRDVSGNG
ncbi:ABC transporter permease [Alicyclobacillus shizuokensis]|uniref:ABC transporter permease n=1 Tax=Alicyclobacillus shizuokensis TaxID=392014 RepID=UPI000833ED52|nr:ABC transporter permease [Alicyclobacillus shizuokensis]MCL6627817.1 ABC transporter permease [Alicyclobacillus shizuokensis]